MDLSFTAIIVITFLGLWLLASAGVQASLLYAKAAPRTKPPARWRSWDYFGLLPRWTFFSRVPESDMTVFYRDRLYDGPLTPWHLVEMPKRTLLRVLWNPGRRKRKALDDLCIGLVNHFARQLRRSAQASPWSFWYLGLAQYVSQLSRCPLSESRQFMIVRTFGSANRKPEILFISPLFQLSGRQTTQEVAHVVASGIGDAPDLGAGAHPCHS